MRKTSDIAYDTASESQKLDLILPESNEFYAVVFIHGGGLEFGDKANDKAHFGHLVKNGYAVVAPNYRMYPSARYPEYVEDSAAAVAWTFKHINEYGKCKGIFVGGSSAGGYLSMMLCFDGRWLAPYGIKPTDVTGWLHVSGQPTCHFQYLQNERGVNSNRVIIDETAPLYHIGEADAYSPMLFIVSDNDMKNRYEQTMLVLSTLKHFGHEDKTTLKIFEGTHCQYHNQSNENGENLLGLAVVEFIKKVTKEK
jgi:dipeptidyl aminopeptidase/acylaminoacyl peptidase